MASQAGQSSLVIDQTTLLSLSATIVLLIIAYIASLRTLPPSTTTKLRILFIWHLFDALIHFIFEGSFLYHCFFTYTSIPPTSDYPHPASLTTRDYFLGHKDRLYGSAYGTSPTAKLWQEYAKADHRWARADLTIISIELLTVFIAGPLAAYVCDLIRRGSKDGQPWFWASVLATGEIYGGFMTFAPEWLTGSPNLNTSNFMYLYVYLIFFNALWVIFPLWVLIEGYWHINLAFNQNIRDVKTRKQKDK